MKNQWLSILLGKIHKKLFRRTARVVLGRNVGETYLKNCEGTSSEMLDAIVAHRAKFEF